MVMSEPNSMLSGQSIRSNKDDVPWRAMGIKAVITILVFVLISILIEKFCEKSVSEFSEGMMKVIGLPGLFIMVFLADGVPQPFTYVPLIFLAVKGGTSKLEVVVICGLASYSAALMGYGIGFSISRMACGVELMKHLSVKYPFVPDLMESKGAVGVGMAALLPVPLAIATWTAGSFKIFFPHFMLAGMCRLPKITVFVLLSRGSGS